VISLQKEDSFLPFEYTGKLKRFLWYKLTLLWRC
jgi:hypothetical protein